MASPLVDLEQELISLTLSLYSKSAVPRNIVQLFVDSLSNFVNNKLMTFMEQQFNSFQVNNSGDVSKTLKKLKVDIENVFSNFKDEYNRFSLYKTKKLMIDSKDVFIAHDFRQKVLNSELVHNKFKICAQYIPMSWSLKIILEVPGLFNLVLKYMNELEEESDIIISNIIQSDLWKNHYKKRKLLKDQFLLPLIFYADDFECGNGLGSHAGKQKYGGGYISIPTLPPSVSSLLKSIILVIIYKSSARKKYGNLKIFQELIAEFNTLQSKGLEIVVGKKKFTVFFQLALIIGDNLGLSEILGFQDYYNHGMPCRICRATIELIKTMTVENKSILRTEKNYDEDVLKNQPKITGIKEKCLFNEVNGYHACRNFTLDLLHDFYEGAASYSMISICDQLIYKENLFSLDYLNERINYVQGCIPEISNEIPEIKKTHIP
ncbi:hypothetical protein TKK_0010467 [Trichogramma kaykai]